MTNKDLIDNYFALINTLGIVIIYWWIAGTGFCGAILKLTYEHNIIKNKTLNVGLACMVIIFFISLITFGLFNSYYVMKIGQSIMALLPLEVLQQGQAESILSRLNWQFLFPTTTPLLFFISWLWLIKQKLHKN